MKTHVNLLPWRLRRQMLIRKRCREWALGLTIACGMPMIWCFLLLQDVEKLQVELQSAKELAEPVRQRLIQNEQLDEEVRRAGRRQQLATQLRTTHSPLQLLGLLSEQARHSDGAVQLRGLQFIAEHSPSETPSKAGSDVNDVNRLEEKLRIGVQGVAVDDQAVSRYLQSLRATGVFGSLELRQTGAREIEQTRIREFSIECVFPFESTRVATRTGVTR